jgi:Asp-tRNA(Asn)/Glu-tRNA(Gln) amidotransferase A subunit family amidase
MPLGKHPNGMPFGIQIMGSGFHEAELLAISNYIMNDLDLA